MACCGMDSGWWRALVSTVMNLRDPQNAGKFLSSCTTGGFSKRVQPLEVSLAQVGIPFPPPALSSNIHRSTVSHFRSKTSQESLHNRFFSSSTLSSFRSYDCDSLQPNCHFGITQQASTSTHSAHVTQWAFYDVSPRCSKEVCRYVGQM
jgi:hypothetical protein